MPDTSQKSEYAPAIIPEPVSVKCQDGYFEIGPDLILVADKASEVTALQLALFLRPICELPIMKSAESGKRAITLYEDKNLSELGFEGYLLEVTPAKVSISAATQAGIFYGIQTLHQLLPPQTFSSGKIDSLELRIPCLTVKDYPRFRWRGLMLDTGHDFQHVSFILRFIDLMAMHKFNTLHWHITDLGTFPLEIKGYPKLQDPSTLGTRMRGEPKRGVKPGYYTQEQVREIVAYAAERHITIVPEVDMPGHSTPVLIAYPEFDCPVAHKTWEWDRWEYCVGNEATYSFLQEVLSQVIDLFPSPFIHIGGDECPKEHWGKCPVCQEKMKSENLQNEEELQSYFVRRIERFLNSKGRRLIGWDEILEGGGTPDAAIMAWRADKQAATIAAKDGHDVVVAYTSHLYFDYPETATPIDKVYTLEPVPQELTPQQAVHILGAQAQMWTDNHPTEKEIERLVYPRACAVSEVVWSPPESRNYAAFDRKLAVHAHRLSELGIDFR